MKATRPELLAFRTSSGFKEWLKQKAQEQGCTVSDVLNKLIEKAKENDNNE